MKNRLKMWDEHPSWEEAEKAWNLGEEKARASQPVQGLAKLPKMAGITPDTAKGLKWKSFRWMLLQDHDRKVLRGFLRHPFRYGWRYLRSLFQSNSYKREGDFFYYGVSSEKQFQSLLEDPSSLLVVGFSYCHKPFECPSGRFTPDCIHDPEHPVCRQCFIGKAIHAMPREGAVALAIPTVHYIGAKIFELLEKHPDKKILFMITACEMTLEMFGDWGNMTGIQGIGVRLDGRICNTMRAFELSENGIKPGLTVVREETKERMLHLLRHRRNCL